MRYIVLVVLMLFYSMSLLAGSPKKCEPMDLSNYAGYYTAADGSFVTLEAKQSGYKLTRGEAFVSSNDREAMQIGDGMILIARTWCGGTRNCSSKACQNSRDSCVSGYRGCKCQ